MFKTIKIENKQIPMKSDGGTLREYRHFFQRDMLSDFMALDKGIKTNEINIEVLENLAWTLAHKANPSIGDIDSWLSSFDNPMSLYQAFPQIQSLLFDSMKTTVKPKKKQKNHHRK